MKSIINYYYKMYPLDIIKNNNIYFFEDKNIKYEFKEINIDPNNLLEIYYLIRNTNLYCHEIILNILGEFITNYNNHMYILLKTNIKKKISIEDINTYSIPLNINSNLKWKTFWEERIDYYEYQLLELNLDKKLESFDYYIGLSETAIQILNYIDEKNIFYSFGHKTFDDYYDPLNIIISPRIRDMVEYLKYLFFNKSISNTELIQILDNFVLINNLNKDEILLMIARFLYPSYYFNEYDNYLQNIKYDFDFIIKKSSEYELLIKQIYNKYKDIYNLINIEWLIN